MLSSGWEQLWIWLDKHQILLGWLGLLSLLTFVGSLIAVPVLVVRLPQDYLAMQKYDRRRRYGIWWWPMQVMKNMVGVVLLLCGMAMLVLPGQGLLTLFIGLSLVNFPGKPLLIKKLVRQRQVMHSINWLRRKFDRAPLAEPD